MIESTNTLILEIAPQETNPQGTCTQMFMAATVINSKKLDMAQECNKGTGSARPMLSRRGKPMGHLNTQEKLKNMLWEKREQSTVGVPGSNGLTCTQRLEGQTDHKREGNKSQIFIRAGLLKLESAFKSCGHFTRMQTLTQEVWGGIRICVLKGGAGGDHGAVTTVSAARH